MANLVNCPNSGVFGDRNQTTRQPIPRRPDLRAAESPDRQKIPDIKSRPSPVWIDSMITRSPGVIDRMTRDPATPIRSPRRAAHSAHRRTEMPRTRYRVTAFEALMLAQDTPTHPMIAQIEVLFTGRLKYDLFNASLARTLANHPLLQSLVDNSIRPKRWIVYPEQAPYFDWAELDAPLRYPNDSDFIDLTQEIGTRVWVRAARDRGRLVLQFHHACTDGTGVLEFTLDLLRTYHALESNRDDLIPARDRQALRQRDRFHGHTRWGRLRKLAGAALRGRHWTKMKPIPLGDTVAGAATPRPLETIRHQTLAPNELNQLLAAARAEGATLNDLLLRDFFLILSKWGAHHAKTAEDCLCVCMPVNLRLPHEAPMPAANKVMLSFLYRSPADCADAQALLQSLHTETQNIKQTRRGLKILEVLRLVMKIQGRIPAGLLGKSSFATAVLTNLGRINALARDMPSDHDGKIQCGGLTVDRIVTAPNGQMGTPAVIVASTYASRLTIAICHDQSALTREQAEQLLQDYVARLRESAQSQANRC